MSTLGSWLGMHKVHDYQMYSWSSIPGWSSLMVKISSPLKCNVA